MCRRAGACTRGNPLELRFYGVRGSTPCAAPENVRFGGNTACVVLSGAGRPPLILDLGTGLRNYGNEWGWTPFEGTVLVSHLHWDHIQGLPFFRPMHHPDSVLHLYGPTNEGVSMETAFDGFMCPPYFPVGIGDLAGRFVFHDVPDTSFDVAGMEVSAAMIPHCGPSLGYRIEVEGTVIAYVSDHQQPIGRPDVVDPAVLELCRAADVLIHDAQYTPEEFDQRQDWGHCTMAYAVEVAAQAGADQLILFHHDPGHDDDQLDDLGEATAKEGAGRVGSVVSAYEGLALTF